MFFRRAGRPEDYMVCHGESLLVRLSYTGWSELYSNYVPGFVGISAGEWETALAGDARDVPWVLVGSESGKAVPFCKFSIAWVAFENRVSLKYCGSFPAVRDDWWTRVKGRFGVKPEEVSQERAPWDWRKVSRRSIMKGLRSDEPEIVLITLFKVGACTARGDAAWASELLMSYANRDDVHMRRGAM